ncbi:flagellar hook-length control protein FliK [Alcaligenaceae bacterium]|nr:flagellar hook-length control protein FliK [Alcaligenaceae bacterium]
MSIGGPSALGTLLVHRLDSVLGTTLSQQANVVSGARPDAVTQPGSPDRTDAAKNETHRQTREGVDRATAQTGQHTKEAINRARIDARAAEILAARSAPSTSTTQSAPTSLGHAARTILALLANFPDQAAAVQGKTPLLTANPRSANSNPGNAPATGGNIARAETTATLNRGPGIVAAPSASGAAGPLGATAAATATGQATSSVPAQLAQALAHTLQRSGMFYESHLHNLAFGKQTPAQLEQEPQAQAGRGAPEGAPGSGKNAATTTTQQPASTPGQPGSNNASAASAQASRGETMHAGQNAPAPAAPNTPVPVPGLDPQTHQLVRQQLEVLANQTFAWRGEAWPDAPMEWEVSRREPSREDTLLSAETDQWATRINIQLPSLGNVQARLTLAGQQLVMHLIAPESSSLLKDHTEALRKRYSALGMQLSQLSVSRNAWEAAGGGQQIPDNPTAAFYPEHDSANATHDKATDA